MRNPLLLATLLLALPTVASAQRAPQTPPPTRGIAGELLPKGDTLEAVVGATGSTLLAPAVAVTGVLAPGVYQLRFDDPGTGWAETVLIGVPDAPLLPAPLVVAYHGYGGTPNEILQDTNLFAEARARGWFVVAPLGAHQFNFGIDYAQQNVAYVLDWLLNAVQIDRQRIYGVGFSMGGGWALSQAARHLDPSRAMFAAVTNHTGTVSLTHLWWTSADPSLFHHPLMFGGPPSVNPFGYERVSSIDLDPVTLAVNPTNDMARNLKHVATRTWTATQDPLANLLVQNAALVSWLLQGGHPTLAFNVRSSQHTWATLNVTSMLDDFAQQTLTIPTSGTRKLLADRDDTFLFFEVRQDAPGAFTPFRYNLDPAQNRLVVDQSQNLARLKVDTLAAGLDPGQPLLVMIGVSDGLAEEIVLRGYPNAPQNVLRMGRSTPNWSHDPVAGTLTLFESNGAGYPTWTILP